MHRSHLALASLALVAAGAIAVPLATASADSGPKRASLVLTETSIGFNLLDVPGTEADGQAGDIGTFESTMSDKGGTVGSLAGQCIQLRADGTLDDCSVTMTVGADSFRMGGLFDPATGGTFAILGGTGRWVGAGGTDTIVNQPDGTAIHTINLTRP